MAVYREVKMGAAKRNSNFPLKIFLVVELVIFVTSLVFLVHCTHLDVYSTSHGFEMIPV